ncbi:MAG: hypothetical protein HDT39_10535 [Lachnospiraceae bacterium]|nr:hypothetical protein [Lachnospiraceae bacterium]
MIRPVEFQGVIQRSQDVTQIKAHEDGKPQQQHSTIVMNQEKTAVENHETVVKQENADKKQEKYDAKEKGKGTYYKIKKKKKEEQSEDDGTVVKKETSFFDMKI